MGEVVTAEMLLRAILELIEKCEDKAELEEAVKRILKEAK